MLCYKICLFDCILRGRSTVKHVCHFQRRPIFVFNSLLLMVRLLHFRAFQWLRRVQIDGALSLLKQALVGAHCVLTQLVDTVSPSVMMFRNC